MRVTRRRSGIAWLVCAVLLVLNTGHAATGPIVTVGPLISGTSSWVDGTYAWTDYAYDDRADTPASGNAYPSDDLANAADLIQLQLGLNDDGLAIRAVLETLTDRAVPLLGVGIDLDGNPHTGAAGLPAGNWKATGTPLGLERLIVASAAGTRILSWVDRRWVTRAGPPARIDAATNTIDVTIPAARVRSTSRTWRVVGVLGLAGAGQSWLTEGGDIYDLAFVRDTATTNWQSGKQAAVLKGTQDASAAVATIRPAHFRQLRTASAKPTPGIKETFLYRSKLDLGEGIRKDGLHGMRFAGPYQPYAAWFPEGLPANPPLILFLHGAMGTHLSANDVTPNAVVITPLGRNQTTAAWYSGPAEQDVLDALADAQRRFRVDRDRIVLTGYSLGGVGTFRLAQLYPDRWAGAVEMVGAPDLGLLTILEEANDNQRLPDALENLRNLRFRMGHARADELQIIVGVVQPDLAAQQLKALGYDYRYWQFLLRDHLTFPAHIVQCEWDAAIARGRVIDPPRVVYSVAPALLTQDPVTGLNLRHDRAYWMSNLVPRGEAFAPGDESTVDVTSLALPDRTPILASVNAVEQNITAGRDVCGDNADMKTNDVWITDGQAWTGFENEATSNGMVVDLKQVASVQLDVDRMGLATDEEIHIALRTDGDGKLRLKGSWPGTMTAMPDTDSATIMCPDHGVIEIAMKAIVSRIVLKQVPDVICPAS